MKANVYILATLVGVIVLVGVFATAGLAGERGQAKKLYNEYITKAIEKNESKASLQRSRSENLRNASAMAIQKARFLSSNRIQLVEEMVQNQVGLKHYLMDYYLNKRFHENQSIAASTVRFTPN